MQRGLRVVTFSAGLLLPPGVAAVLAWTDRSWGWPGHPAVTISLLGAAVAVGGVLLARSFRQDAPFLAFILPVTMALGAAAAALQQGVWLWLQPDSNGVSAAEGADAARTVVGSAIGMGLPLGFVAAHVVVLGKALLRRFSGAAYANRP